MNTKFIFIALLLLGIANLSTYAADKDYGIKSPDNQLAVKIRVNDSISYSVWIKNTQIVLPSAISMTLQDRVLGTGAVVKHIQQHKVRSELTPLYGKSSRLRDDYNELVIDFSNHYSLIFRAYDQGVAYRFVTDLSDSITVIKEKACFNLSGSPEVIFPETNVFTSWEVPYVKYNSLAAIEEGKRALSPTLFSYKQSGIKVVVAESDLIDYPGMYLQKHNGQIAGTWANYPSKVVMGSWGDFVSVVKERTDFIAKTNGKRTFPWRVIIATADDKDLLNNQLIYKLARPSKMTGTDWIKPGKATWEWWHDAILEGAPIPSGMGNRNTALYKYYIDFAAGSRLEYLMIDAGWSNNYDLRKVNPKVDIKELIRYGKSKNVGVFVWCVASTLIKDLEGNLDFLQSIGASGIKVDFFDRDDQLAIQWFEKIAAAAAKRHLMVDFHGCSKPTGLQRAYPNVVNYEAVRGAECSKWDLTANPDQHLLVPFIRMLAGPLDYTPGSMRNRSKETFKPVDPGLPSTQGTRCHELAMYVVFDQPFAMLCDAPTEYVKYPDLMSFLSAVPTVFDETKVLSGGLGEYAVIAKRKKDKWFVGAMTNWESRTVKLDFSFLPDNKTYTAEICSDAKDANENAEHYIFKKIQVTKATKIELPLAKGGGAVAYLHQ